MTETVQPETGQKGTLSVDGKRATLTFRRYLRHPAEAVWAALTDPQRRALWFGPTRIEGRAGGTIETDPQGPPAPPDLRLMTGRILVWDPPRVLEHEFRQAIVGEGVVRYELTPAGEGTVLAFTHTGLLPPHARGYIPGTHAYLDRLAAVLDGAPAPDWQARYAAVEGSYA
jgi:uncharacterized protein YndB with AHSA1/START domain